MHTNIRVPLKPNFYPNLLLLFAVFLWVHIFYINLKILNLHNKSPAFFAIHILSLKRCLHS